MKMTRTAQAAHELSRKSEERLGNATISEAKHLVEGYITRTIKRACEKGCFGVEFKFPQVDKQIWKCAMSMLWNNDYKVSINPSETIVTVKW
jgi:hypothetical protein